MVVLKRVRDSVDKAVGKRGKKMSDNEIMKCLEGITNATFDEDQSPVIYMKLESAKSILDLINRQKEEISKKDIEIDILIRKKEDLSDEVSDLRAEVERLTKCRKEEVEKLMLATDRVITEAKSEAYKEFAERLEDKSIYLEDEERYFGYAVKSKDIDNILKELTEKGR